MSLDKKNLRKKIIKDLLLNNSQFKKNTKILMFWVLKLTVAAFSSVRFFFVLCYNLLWFVFIVSHYFLFCLLSSLNITFKRQ